MNTVTELKSFFDSSIRAFKFEPLFITLVFCVLVSSVWIKQYDISCILGIIIISFFGIAWKPGSWFHAKLEILTYVAIFAFVFLPFLPHFLS